MVDALIGIGLLLGGMVGFIALLALIDAFGHVMLMVGLVAIVIGAGAVSGHQVTTGDDSEPTWALIVLFSGFGLSFFGALQDF